MGGLSAADVVTCAPDPLIAETQQMSVHLRHPDDNRTLARAHDLYPTIT